MQATPRRDPKKFAQRTMAAAIAAAALATLNSAQAQTTGGGIGAAVNANPNASAGTSTIGTAGGAGGTAAAGISVPNAPSSPVRIGAGPGINNTGSPVVATPRVLQTPIGGAASTARGPSGAPRIPGNTLPNRRPANQPQNIYGTNAPTLNADVPVAPTVGIPAPPGIGVPGDPTVAPDIGRVPHPPQIRQGTVAKNARAGANLRTGTISNFTDSNISFREGATTSTLGITPDTVVQMDGRNITLRDIPANAQVRVERSPTNPNAVQRIVVVPQAAATGAANANANAAGNTLTTQGGTTTNSGSKSVGTRTNFNDINAPNPNATLPSGDINAGTTNASTPNNDVNSPVVNNPNVSNRPLAPGRNAADLPTAPFTRGSDQPLQAGFTEAGTQQGTTPNNQAVTDGSQFLGPARGNAVTKPGIDPPSTMSGAANVSATGTTAAGTPAQDPKRIEFNAAQQTALSSRLGLQTTRSTNGVTVGNVMDNSIAARSGFMAGDRLQSINGRPISSSQDFGRALAAASNQQAITAQVMRNGSLTDVNLALPNGFFNGFTATGVLGAGATNGLSPAVSVGANGQVTPGVATGGGVVVSPTTSEVNTAATQQSTLDATVAANQRSIVENQRALAGDAAAAATATTQQAPAVTDRTALQTQPTRVRQPDVAVGTQKNPITTEALKVPPFDLGGELKATPEGVVVSSLVNDGLAASAKLESGDIIESIDGRPITAPGAVSYEMNRHRAGSVVDVGILRDGKRITRQMKLPADHEPQFLNRSETFGAANNEAKEQGASGARPIPLKPTEESIRTLESENQALREQIEQLRKSQNAKP